MHLIGFIIRIYLITLACIPTSFKEQNVILHTEWRQSRLHVCKVYDVLMEWMSVENVGISAKYQVKSLKFKNPFY